MSATSPDGLLAEVSTGFRTARRLLTHRQRTADQVRLVRVAAKLAMVAGNLLLGEGKYGLSACWYRTAHHAACDRYLTDLALGEHAYIPVYTGDPSGVLAMLDPRLTQRTRPTPAVAFLWASKARAHATLGEHDAFTRAIEHARTALDDSPTVYATTGIFLCTTGKVAFYETTGRVRLRDTTGALESADRALGSIWVTVRPRLSSRSVMLAVHWDESAVSAIQSARACQGIFKWSGPEVCL